LSTAPDQGRQQEAVDQRPPARDLPLQRPAAGVQGGWRKVGRLIFKIIVIIIGKNIFVIHSRILLTFPSIPLQKALLLLQDGQQQHWPVRAALLESAHRAPGGAVPEPVVPQRHDDQLPGRPGPPVQCQEPGRPVSESGFDV
jgi:hypothetical protein